MLKPLLSLLLLALIISFIVFFFTSITRGKEVIKSIHVVEVVDKAYEVRNRVEFIIHSESLKSGVNPEYMIKLAQCESSMNPKAINVNKNGTRDLGLWQVNDVNGLSDEFRFDVYESTYWTLKQIQEGRSWMWVCDKKIK